MIPRRSIPLSSTAMALVWGTTALAQTLDLSGLPDLPAEAQLQTYGTFCAQGVSLPELDCALVQAAQSDPAQLPEIPQMTARILGATAAAAEPEAPLAEAVEIPDPEAPVAEAVETLEPEAETPEADAPAAEAVEAPVVEEPAAEAVEAPVVEEPAADAVEAPVVEEPVADAVEAPEPATAEAEAAEPEAPVAEAQEASEREAPAVTAADAPEQTAPVAEAETPEPETPETMETDAREAPATDAADTDVAAEPAVESDELDALREGLASDAAEAEPDAPTDPVAAEETPTADPPAAEPGSVVEDGDTGLDALREGLAADAQEAEPQAPPVSAEATDAPVDAQAEAEAQAALAAQAEAAAPAAAAAAAGDGGGERVEQVITEADVRRSDEDFDTGVTAAAAPTSPRARDDDDDDEAQRRRNQLFAGAAIGLGALALNEILKGDDQVVSNSGDRVVIENNGRLRVLRDDDVLLRRPGAEVDTYRFDDGSSRTVVTYEDDTVVETVRAADGRVLRRSRTLQDGREVVLFDDTQASQAVVVNDLPQATDVRAQQPRVTTREADGDALARALQAQGVAVNRTFSLNQVRAIDAVRKLVPEITVDTITFETNSAAIRPDEAEELAALGNAMREAIRRNPGEVFLIEGHTDAVGSAAYNLPLSDRRAESVALALTEYFRVPPENMVLQGYGESDLAVPTTEAERANRRVGVRRITGLLQ